MAAQGGGAEAAARRRPPAPPAPLAGPAMKAAVAGVGPAAKRAARAARPELQRRGYAVVDAAVAADAAAVALWGARCLQAGGRLRPVPGQAALGRTDEVCVLQREPRAPGGYALAGGGTEEDHAAAAAVALAAAQALDGAADALAGFGPGLAAPPLLQLALYSPGAAYPRHLDNDPGAGAAEYTQGPPGLRVCDREVTGILYLGGGPNAGAPWEPERDGGLLRIWEEEGGGEEGDGAVGPPAGPPAMEVAPSPGRLVLFDSRRVWHEVAPSRRERWALSAWMPRSGAG